MPQVEALQRHVGSRKQLRVVAPGTKKVPGSLPRAEWAALDENKVFEILRL